MRYKESRFIRLLTNSGVVLFILLITVSILPALWERSVALGVSYKEESASNAQNQVTEIGIAVYKPQVRSGVIKPVAFVDRLARAIGREIGFKAGPVETVDRAKAKEVAASLGFNFILFTTIDGDAVKPAKGKGVIGALKKKIPGVNDGAGDKNDTKPMFKVEVEFVLEAVDQNNPILKGKSQGLSRNDEDAVGEAIQQMALSVINIARETIALQRAKGIDTNETGGNKTPVKADVASSKNRPRLVVQTSHSTFVNDYAYNPDGSLLATMGSDGVVKIWNTAERKEINTFPGFRTVGITFSPDGKNLAILSKEGVVRIFDTATGELIRKMSELTVNKQDGGKKSEGIGLIFNTPVSMAYSPDGSFLVTGGERGIRVWDVSSGRTKQTIHEEIHLLALSPDGKIVAGASEDEKNAIKLWSTSDGGLMSEIDAKVEVVTALMFSPDGKSLACGSRNGSIKLFDVSSGQEKEKVIVDRCDALFEKSHRLSPIMGKIPGIGKIRRTIDDAAGLAQSACQIDRTVKEGLKQGLTRALMNYLARSIRSISLNSDGDLIAFVTGDGVIKARSIRGTRELYHLGMSVFGDKPEEDTKQSSKDRKKDDKSERADVLESSFFFQVAPIKFSTDGNYLNGVTGFKNVSRWEAGTGKEVSALAVSNRDLMGGFFLPIPLGAVPIFTKDGSSIITASLTKGTKLWDLKRGAPPRQVSGISALGNKAPISPDGRLIARLIPKAIKKEKKTIVSTTVSISDLISGRERSKIELEGYILAAHFSPDQRFIAVHLIQDGYIVKLYELSNWKEAFSYKDVTHFEFSGDGQLLACLSGQEGETDDIKVFKIGGWNEVFKVKVKGLRDRRLSSPMAFSADGNLLAVIDGNSIKIWNISTKELYRQRELDYMEDLSNLIFVPGKLAISYTTYHSLYHWMLEPNEVKQSSMITDFWGNLSYSKDGKILALGGAENRIRLFNIEEDKEIGSLVVPSQEDWLVVTPEGRLDASRLEEVQEVHWVMPDNPFKPLSLEIFMQDYYETTLLQRLLDSKESQFRAIPDLTSRNRVQPLVKISGIKPQNAAADLVAVEVEVINNVGSFIRGGKEEKVNSGVYNVRLFRDGQRVGVAPKGDGPVKLESGKTTILFKNIRAPLHPGAKSVEFSAYAFNSDRVKSETANATYELPRPTQTAERRAYIITMGVGVGPHSLWNLKATVLDARAIEKLLVEKLKPNYEVISIPLISAPQDGETQREFLGATKENLGAALSLLAGGAISPERREKIPNASRMRAATPDDLVVVFIASHGVVTPGGKLYLIPYFDMDGASAVGQTRLAECAQQAGEQSKCALARKFLDLSISADDFAKWFEDVDAGEIALILDSCHSGAFGGNEFKPGPFADKGFGQLSYDKGMMILAATQSNSSARADDDSSILTKALIRQAEFAGAFNLRDWLSRARYDAPYNPLPSDQDAQVQIPLFFDFARKKTTSVAPAAPVAK